MILCWIYTTNPLTLELVTHVKWFLQVDIATLFTHLEVGRNDEQSKREVVDNSDKA